MPQEDVEAGSVSGSFSKNFAAHQETIRAAGSAPGLSWLSLKGKLQAELNQAWEIDGIGYHAKVLIVIRATGSIRRSELRMVEEVEELRPEFNVHSLGDRSLLKHCEVKVDDSLLTQGGIDARFIAKAITAGVSKAAGVEPT
jgi:hypothetical protein